MKIYILIANEYNEYESLKSTFYASTSKEEVERRKNFLLDWGYTEISKYSLETNYNDWEEGWEEPYEEATND